MQTDRYGLDVPCSAADLDCSNQAIITDSVTRSVEAGTPFRLAGAVVEDPKGIVNAPPLSVTPRVPGLYLVTVSVIWDLFAPYQDRRLIVTVQRNGSPILSKVDAARIGGGHATQGTSVIRVAMNEALTFFVESDVNLNFVFSQITVNQIGP